MPTIERETLRREKFYITYNARNLRASLTDHQRQRARQDKFVQDYLKELQACLARAYALNMKTHEIWGEEKE